jgi:hypothetical protein
MQCEECGREFRSKGDYGQRFCTDKCRGAFHRRRYRALAVEEAEFVRINGHDPGTPEQREEAHEFLDEFVQPAEPIKRRA